MLYVIKSVIPTNVFKGKSAPWIDGKVIYHLKIKEKCWKKAIASGFGQHWSDYKKVSDVLNNLIRRKHRNF